jgi:hypothetical protein
VQVRHGFAAVRAVVDDEPVAAWLQTHLGRDFGGLEQQVSEQVAGRPFLPRRCAESVFLGTIKTCVGRLRMDVAEGEHENRLHKGSPPESRAR